MNPELDISPAEWQVMRIVWTKKRVTSKEIIEILQRKVDWKPATVKTLLIRLVQKKVLKATKEGRCFIYEPLVGEQDTMNTVADELFSSMCEMHLGSTLAYVIAKHQLSQNDIKKIQSILDKKIKTAPEMVECNCVPGENISCM